LNKKSGPQGFYPLWHFYFLETQNIQGKYLMRSLLIKENKKIKCSNKSCDFEKEK